jgi:hypothetical protein
MGKIQSAFSHHLDQIAIAQLETEVPTHAQNDHLAVEVPTRKQLFHAAQIAHKRSSTA